MVAHLLELHHGGEDQAAAFDPIGLVDPRQHVIDDRLVEAGLLAGSGWRTRFISSLSGNRR